MRTKYTVWTGVVAILALAVFVPSTQAQTVVGTAHDLSSTGPGAQTNVTRVCVFCHTPHQAAAANAQDPLWNHTLSATASYGVYGSATMNATGGETITMFAMPVFAQFKCPLTQAPKEYPARSIRFIPLAAR